MLLRHSNETRQQHVVINLPSPSRSKEPLCVLEKLTEAALSHVWRELDLQLKTRTLLRRHFSIETQNAESVFLIRLYLGFARVFFNVFISQTPAQTCYIQSIFKAPACLPFCEREVPGKSPFIRNLLV